MSATPKVSVLCITYNQEKYIRQAIESFIAQKTDFEFEVVVADDCSTDRTPQIIKEFAQAYPAIVRPIFQKKNGGVLKNFMEAFRAARGDYIAICEGDDFWTDPIKLKVQVNFMDSHPGYALCFHPVRVFFENGDEEDSIYPEDNEASKFTVGELLKRNFIQTNSVMYRRQNYHQAPSGILPVDWYFHLLHAQYGKIGFIDSVMSAYRRHPGGIWWNGYKDVNLIWEKYGLAFLKLLFELLEIYGDNKEYAAAIYVHMETALSGIYAADKSAEKAVIKKAIKEFPNGSATFLESLLHVLQEKNAQLGQKSKEAQELTDELSRAKAQAEEYSRELRTIKASRTWKIRSRAARFLGNK